MLAICTEEGKGMKEFNIVIAGVGGQGVLTLTKILADAAMLQGYDVKTSELHGLSQRGGPIPSHVRFGKNIYSSVIMEGEANLIIGLEPLEALRSCYFGSKDNSTTFIINNHRMVSESIRKYPALESILDDIKKFSSERYVLNATDAAKELAGTDVFANIYLLGYASRFIPLKKKFILKAMDMNIKKKYLTMNKKVFEIGSQI